MLSRTRRRVAELCLLRDKADSAWGQLLAAAGETRQSTPSDTEFWADMQVGTTRTSQNTRQNDAQLDSNNNSNNIDKPSPTPHLARMPAPKSVLRAAFC